MELLGSKAANIIVLAAPHIKKKKKKQQLSQTKDIQTIRICHKYFDALIPFC